MSDEETRDHTIGRFFSSKKKSLVTKKYKIFCPIINGECKGIVCMFYRTGKAKKRDGTIIKTKYCLLGRH